MLDSSVLAHPASNLQEPVLTANANGTSPFVILCDHATNRIPAKMGNLGLSATERVRHIAWDPGALAVSRMLCELVDAPLVYSTVSRLVIDCNRHEDAPDLIPEKSEDTAIPDNANLDAVERGRRITEYHAPYHAQISQLLDRRAQRGLDTVIVAMHSFTPVYRRQSRVWDIGLIHGENPGFAREVERAALADASDITLGWNEPYSNADGVTYTLERHADARGIDSVMVEIRHDHILEPKGAARWAYRLARWLPAAAAARPAASSHPDDAFAHPAH